MAELLDLDALAPKSLPVGFTDCDGERRVIDVGRISFGVGLRVIQHSQKFSGENLRPIIELARSGESATEEQYRSYSEIMRAMLEIIEAIAIDQGVDLSVEKIEKSLTFAQIVKIVELATAPVISYIAASKGLGV